MIDKEKPASNAKTNYTCVVCGDKHKGASDKEPCPKTKGMEHYRGGFTIGGLNHE